jgi:hypothetical protein
MHWIFAAASILVGAGMALMFSPFSRLRLIPVSTDRATDFKVSVGVGAFTGLVFLIWLISQASKGTSVGDTSAPLGAVFTVYALACTDWAKVGQTKVGTWAKDIWRGVNGSGWTNVALASLCVTATVMTSSTPPDYIGLSVGALTVVWVTRWAASRSRKNGWGMLLWLSFSPLLLWDLLFDYASAYYPWMLEHVSEGVGVTVLTLLTWMYMALVANDPSHAKLITGVIQAVAASLLAAAFLSDKIDLSPFLVPADPESARYLKENPGEVVERLLQWGTFPYVLSGIWTALLLDFRLYKRPANE